MSFAMASSSTDNVSTTDKKRSATSLNVQDEPVAKRKCLCQEIEERNQLFGAWLSKRFPETSLKYPCTIKKVTALPDSHSQENHNVFAVACPKGLNFLQFQLSAKDILVCYRESLETQKQKNISTRRTYNDWTRFDGFTVWPDVHDHKYDFQPTKTDTTTFLSGPTRVATKVTTSSRIESAHPLEQAWFDADERRNLDARGFFDMSKCNVSSIIVPVLPLQNDTFVQVTITDGPVTRNMLVSALEQVLEQPFTLEIRQLLWAAVKDADNLDSYDHDGESMQMDTKHTCIGDFIKGRTVVDIQKMKELDADWNCLRWTLDCPYKETMFLHLED